MQRREQNLQVAWSRQLALCDGIEVGGITLGSDDLHAPIGQRLGKRHAADLLALQHSLNDPFVVRRQNLCAVGPVDFDGVVARRVMAGGDHDAAGALLVANCKGELWRGAVLVEEVDLKTVSDHDPSAQLGKMPRAVPGVVGDGARQVAFTAAALDHVIGQSLGALTNRAVVDGIGTDRVHPSASAAGAEGNDRPEGVIQMLPFPVVDVLDHLIAVIGVAAFSQPLTDVFDRRGAQRAGLLCLGDFVQGIGNFTWNGS